MIKISPAGLGLLVWVFLAVAGLRVEGQDGVPEVLRPWQGWVLWDAPERDCPRSYLDGKERICVWPSRLELGVTAEGGTFGMSVRVFGEQWLTLPGGREAWPQGVMVNGAPAVVVEREGRPAVRLKPGEYKLTGSYVWKGVPQSLPLPREAGVLALTLNGARVEAPAWDAAGVLWLRPEATGDAAAERDFLSTKVYGLVEDGNPLWLRVRVELVVSGKSREEEIGGVLPEGWRPAAVVSGIPVMVDEAGRLRAQVRTGRWSVEVSAFRLDTPGEIRYAAGVKPAVADELIALAPAPDLRMVEMTGAPSVDVTQTSFPEDWRSFTVYRWNTGEALGFVERMRGMGLEKPAGLKIARELWLGEDGRGFTFRDHIGGVRQQIWRLDVAEGQELGSVRSGEEGQLITRNPENGAEGVEIRVRDLDLTATGTVARKGEMPAAGWRADADELAVLMNLPPGWRLFALFGADWVRGDWLTAWSLLDLFLLLIFTLAVQRLWGWGAAGLAFVGFGLAYHEPGAPRFVWLGLLAPLALLRVAPEGWMRRVVQVGKWVMIALLVLTLAPFVAGQVQSALYPQLEQVGEGGRALVVYSARAPGDFSASVVSSRSNKDVMVTREYAMPPGFFGGNAANMPVGTRSMPQEFLEGQGVTFPPGASAMYRPEKGKLIVRNTAANQDLVGSMMDAAMAVGSSSNNMAYDAKARIQTGPGVPEWTWRQVEYGWNGPVEAGQKVRAMLIPRDVERGLMVLRVALLLALAGVLLGAWPRRRVGIPKAAAVVLGALVLTAAPVTARAQMPDEKLLSTLRERLLKTPDAFPNAAAVPMATLTLRERNLAMEAEIHAAAGCAVPLPGKLAEWSPLSVQVDGKPATAVRRVGDALWVALDEGVHRVRVEGVLANVTEWQWTFPLRPHLVRIDAPDWNVSGVSPAGVPEQQVFFTRKQKAAAVEAGYDREDYQSVAAVERSLELGLVWQVRTKVRRLSPEGKALALRIPLLPGENVLTPDAIVEQGMIEVRLAARQEEYMWESELPVTPHLKLETRKGDTWVERWSLEVSPVWNISTSGLAPIFERDSQSLEPVWRPWPGESVELAISRPVAVPGATTTVSRVNHEISLGNRQYTSKLELKLLCSLGEDFVIELPKGAEVTSLRHDDDPAPVRRDGDKVILPLRPGEQTVTLGWKVNRALSLMASAGAVRLPVESANINTEITVPESRWVLWTHGPLRGPAVRFWTVLVCSLLAAWVLGRLAHSPLRSWEWMLLALGLTQAPLPAALTVIGWLFLLAWRGRPGFLALPTVGFNGLQLIVAALTGVSLAIFVVVVAEGLLGDPRMFILGNGSTATELRWYAAQSEGGLPQPGVVSISIWWYRLAMLVWALWLAASLLRWLRWGWGQFSLGGFFRRGKKKTMVMPPPLGNA